MINYRYIKHLTSFYCDTYEMYVHKKLGKEKCNRTFDLSAFTLDELDEWSKRLCLECYAVSNAFDACLKLLFDARRTFRKLEDSHGFVSPCSVEKVLSYYLNQGVENGKC